MNFKSLLLPVFLICQSHDCLKLEYDFKVKLAESIAQSWQFLPYQNTNKLTYHLYGRGNDFIASSSPEGTQSVIYWTGSYKERYLYIISSNDVEIVSSGLRFHGHVLNHLESWTSGRPAID